MKDNNIYDTPEVSRESVIREHLSLTGARVIDIGCGEGWLGHLIAPEAARVIGIDPSTTAIERATAAKTSHNEFFLLGSADNLPVDDAWADVVIYYNSLHHVPADVQNKAIAETARVLVPGGTLCIVEPVARGAAYELFQPVEDESAVYAATYKLILETGNGTEFQQDREELFVDFYSYQDFEDFLDEVLVVDESRAETLTRLTDMLRQRFEQLGESAEAGRRYDQLHRLNLLHRS